MAVVIVISRKCRYALRAIFELAWRGSDGGLVKVQDIAAAQAIPVRFLEVILAELKHGGFVRSKRGNEGGYVLAQPPQAITVGEVISFLQDGRESAEEAEQGGQGGRELVGNYAFSRMWKRISHEIASIYNGVTFADLVEHELRGQRTYVPNYAI